MILNLDFTIKDASDSAIIGKAGSILSSGVLAMKTDGISPIKAMDWANELRQKQTIDIDRADLDALRMAVEQSDLLNFAKAPILLAIRDVAVTE